MYVMSVREHVTDARARGSFFAIMNMKSPKRFVSRLSARITLGGRRCSDDYFDVDRSNSGLATARLSRPVSRMVRRSGEYFSNWGARLGAWLVANRAIWRLPKRRRASKMTISMITVAPRHFCSRHFAIFAASNILRIGIGLATASLGQSFVRQDPGLHPDASYARAGSRSTRSVKASIGGRLHKSAPTACPDQTDSNHTTTVGSEVPIPVVAGPDFGWG
jgi:hypothetical protein